MNYLKLTIETERLKLIPVEGQYREEAFREFTSEITTYMYPKPLRMIEELDARTASVIEDMKLGKEYEFYVIDKNTEEFVGRGGLHNADTKIPEFGIWIKKSAHGNGYGKEAIHGLKKWADQNLAYDYITYPVDKRNIASRKIPESLGGEVKREFKQINMAGNELDEVEYWIYPNNT